jgi:hypothetical protein
MSIEIAMKHIFFLFLFVSSILMTSGQAKFGSVSKTKPELTLLAEWPTLRGNNKRDGRIDATGQFTNGVTLSQSIDYATSEAYVELITGGGNAIVKYSKGEKNNASLLESISAEWQNEARAYLDFGDGKVTKVNPTQNIKYARLFEGDSGYYRIEAIDGYDVTGNVNNDVFIGVRVYKGNTDKLVFEKRFPKGDFMQRPHVMVADMNNDRQKDIVVTSWEGIYVIDNKGEFIGSLSQNVEGWHKLRKRGFASIADVDDNGYNDVVIISSLPWHVDVIKNDKGVLKFGWTKIFDGLVESAKKISKPILNSVSDFDGDGSYEILVNVFNYDDDNNWTGILFDATSGNVKAQIEGAYVLSANDINNDGSYVFFCTETRGQSVPIAAPLRVVTFKNGSIKNLLRIGKGEWINPRIANISPTTTAHYDGISSLADDVVLCVDFENIGQKAFFAKIQNAEGTSVINGYYISSEGKVRKTGLNVLLPGGMYGEIVRSKKLADGKHSLLLQVKASGLPEGNIRISGANAKNLGRVVSSGQKSYIPVVADINADGHMEILLPNDVGELLCFSRNSRGDFNLKWKVPGHGMLWQYAPLIDYGVSADDINHDGYKEIIVSGANEVGAVIFVYDHNGKVLWTKDFPEINGGDITLFDGNMGFFGTAQSSKRKNRDVIVTVQRGIAHSAKTYCFDGTNGTLIWELDRLIVDKGPGQGSPINSGSGGNVFSVYDINGDGSDEVMCGYGNVVFFANANDGSIVYKEFMRKLFTDKYDYPSKGYSTFWIQQILPVPFNDGSRLLLSCFNTVVAAGTMDKKGVLTWCPSQLEYNERYWQCMTNLDGEGKPWVVELSLRNSDGIPVLFAYDPVSGVFHKTFSIEMPGFAPYLGSGIMPVACDINGDGKDEIVISNNTGVYCIGQKDGKASVLWRYEAKNCGPAVVADIDSDGFVEIIAATQEGKILILDK